MSAPDLPWTTPATGSRQEEEEQTQREVEDSLLSGFFSMRLGKRKYERISFSLTGENGDRG